MAAVVLMNVDDDVLSLYNALGMAKDKLDIRNNNALRLPGALSELFITVSIPLSVAACLARVCFQVWSLPQCLNTDWNELRNPSRPPFGCIKSTTIPASHNLQSYHWIRLASFTNYKRRATSVVTKTRLPGPTHATAAQPVGL